MAKSNNKDTDDFDFDDELDFNFDFDESSVDEGVNSDSRKPVVKAFKSTLSGAKKTMLNPGVIKDLAVKALPTEYSTSVSGLDGSAFDQVGSLASSASELYHEAVQKVKPEANRLFNQVNKLVPENQKRTRGFLDKLRAISGFEEEQEQEQKREVSEEDEKVQSELAAIFEAKSEQDSEERAQDQAEGLIKTKIEQERFETDAQRLEGIHATLGRLSDYNDRINAAYQKKSLELQYRSYFVQATIAKNIAEYFNVFKTQGDAIVKNTGLPEFVKQKDSERFKELSRTKFFNQIQTGLFGSGAGIDRGIQKIKRSMENVISDAAMSIQDLRYGIDDLRGGLDMAADMDFDMDGNDNRTRSEKLRDLALEHGAEGGGGFAVKLGLGRLADIARKKLTDPESPYRNWVMKGAQYGTDIPASLRELARSNMMQLSTDEATGATMRSSATGALKETAKNIIGLFTDSTDLHIGDEQGFADLTKPAVFDTVTKRSIDQIIPGYLARILREVQIFRTGNESIALTDYDHQSNRFVDRAKIVKNIRNKLSSTIGNDDFKRKFKEIEETLGVSEYSPEAQNAMRSLLVKVISDTRSGIIDSKTLMDDSLYQGIDANVADEIKQQLKSRYDDSQSDYVDKNFKLNQGTMVARKALRAPQAEIEQLVKLGRQDILEELGIVSKGAGGYYAVEDDIEALPSKIRREVSRTVRSMQPGDRLYDRLAPEVQQKVRTAPLEVRKKLEDIERKFAGQGSGLYMSYKGYQDWLRSEVDGRQGGLEADDNSEALNAEAAVSNSPNATRQVPRRPRNIRAAEPRQRRSRRVRQSPIAAPPTTANILTDLSAPTMPFDSTPIVQALDPIHTRLVEIRDHLKSMPAAPSSPPVPSYDFSGTITSAMPSMSVLPTQTDFPHWQTTAQSNFLAQRDRLSEQWKKIQESAQPHVENIQAQTEEQLANVRERVKSIDINDIRTAVSETLQPDELRASIGDKLNQMRELFREDMQAFLEDKIDQIRQIDQAKLQQTVRDKTVSAQAIVQNRLSQVQDRIPDAVWPSQAQLGINAVRLNQAQLGINAVRLNQAQSGINAVQLNQVQDRIPDAVRPSQAQLGINAVRLNQAQSGINAVRLNQAQERIPDAVRLSQVQERIPDAVWPSQAQLGINAVRLNQAQSGINAVWPSQAQLGINAVRLNQAQSGINAVRLNQAQERIPDAVRLSQVQERIPDAVRLSQVQERIPDAVWPSQAQLGINAVRLNQAQSGINAVWPSQAQSGINAVWPSQAQSGINAVWPSQAQSGINAVRLSQVQERIPDAVQQEPTEAATDVPAHAAPSIERAKDWTQRVPLWNSLKKTGIRALGGLVLLGSSGLAFADTPPTESLERPSYTRSITDRFSDTASAIPTPSYSAQVTPPFREPTPQAPEVPPVSIPTTIRTRVKNKVNDTREAIKRARGKEPADEAVIDNTAATIIEAIEDDTPDASPPSPANAPRTKIQRILGATRAIDKVVAKTALKAGIGGVKLYAKGLGKLYGLPIKAINDFVLKGMRGGLGETADVLEEMPEGASTEKTAPSWFQRLVQSTQKTDTEKKPAKGSPEKKGSSWLMSGLKKTLKVTRAIDRAVAKTVFKAGVGGLKLYGKSLGKLYGLPFKALGSLLPEGLRGGLPSLSTLPWKKQATEEAPTPTDEAPPAPRKDTFWNRSMKKVGDLVSKGKELPGSLTNDMLRRFTNERTVAEDNQEPGQTQRHFTQMQSLDFLRSFMKKKTAEETEGTESHPDAYNDQDHDGTRDGSWRQRVKGLMRRGFQGKLAEAGEMRYKSSKNVIDEMLEKAQALKDKLTKGEDDALDALEDLDLDNDEDDKKRKKSKKQRLKEARQKKLRARKPGGRWKRLLEKGKSGTKAAAQAVKSGVNSVARFAKSGLQSGRVASEAAENTGGLSRIAKSGWDAVKAGGSTAANAIKATANTAKTGLNAVDLGGKAAKAAGWIGKGVNWGSKALAGMSLLSGTAGAAEVVSTGAGIAGAVGGGGVISTLTGLLASPLVGVAAAGLTLYGLYEAYKWITQDDASPYDKIRLTQYGLTEKEKDHNHQLFQLEELLKNTLAYTSNDPPQFVEKQIPTEQILALFEISTSDTARLERFMAWFNNRFKPVYVLHMAALRKVNRKVSLKDLGDLTPEQKKAYLDLVAYPEGPYTVTASPFEEPATLTAGADTVQAALDVARLALSKESKGKTSTASSLIPSESTSATKDALSKQLESPLPAGYVSKASPVSQIVKAVPSLLVEEGLAGGDLRGTDGKLLTRVSSRITPMMDGAVTALEAVRFKTYGLTTLSRESVDTLRKLEAGLCNELIVDKNARATFDGDIVQILKDYGQFFGIPNAQHEQAPIWTRWFRLRFLPVFLEYIGIGVQQTGKKEPVAIEATLKPNARYALALRLSGLPDVWNVQESPWMNGSSGQDPKIVDENLNYLQIRSKQESLQQQKAVKPKEGEVNTGIKPLDDKAIKIPDQALEKQESLDKGQEGEQPTWLKADQTQQEQQSETRQVLSTKEVVTDQGPMATGEGGGAFLRVGAGVDMSGVNPEVIQNLKAMAEDYGVKTGKKIQINSAFRSKAKQEELHRKDPVMTAKPGHSLHEFGLALDIASADANALEELGLMRKYGFTRPVGQEDWHTEPAGIQVNLEKAKADPNFASRMVQASIGHGGGGYGITPGAAKVKRNHELAMKLLGDVTESSPQLQATNGAEDLKAKPTAATETDTSAPANGTGQGQGLALQTKTFGAVGGNAPGTGSGTGASGIMPTATSSGYGGSVTSSGGGKGWATADEGESKITASNPEIKATPPGKKEILNIIDEAAKETGVNPNTLEVFAAQESSLNPNASRGARSAQGLFQFLPGTWQEQVKKNDPKFEDVRPDSSPFDPKASAILAAQYMKDNFKYIKNLVPDLGPVEAYLTHLLGPGDARKFFSSDPETTAIGTIKGASSEGNRSLFQVKGQPLSIRASYENIKNILRNKAAQFGIKMEEGPNAVTGTGNYDAVAGATAPAPGQGLSMVVQKKPSDQLAGYIGGKPVVSQSVANADRDKTAIADNPNAVTTTQPEPQDPEGPIDLSRRSMMPPVTDAVPTSGYTDSVVQTTAENPRAVAPATIPGLTPTSSKMDWIAPAMQDPMSGIASPMMQMSSSMTALGEHVTGVNDTLKSSLKVQEEMLDVMKTLASNLNPEQLQALIKGLNASAPTPTTPGTPSRSAIGTVSDTIPASAINLTRTAA